MLSQLLNPQWESGDKPFAELLVDWENDVSRYELQSGKPFSDEYRIATLLMHAPEPYKTVLRSAPATSRGTYVMLRAHLREWMASGRSFAAAPGGDAMEVGLY